MFQKTITVKGMHATYWKALCAGSGEVAGPNSEGNFKLFNRYMDAYLVAPLLGCLNNRKGSALGPSEDEAGMQANILIKNSQTLTTLLRTIVLVDESSGYSTIEKIERAFKGDNDPTIKEANMKLFNDYFLGGLEIMYEEFSEATSNEDYIDHIYKFVDNFYRDMNIDQWNDPLPE